MYLYAGNTFLRAGQVCCRRPGEGRAVVTENAPDFSPERDVILVFVLSGTCPQVARASSGSGGCSRPVEPRVSRSLPRPTLATRRLTGASTNRETPVLDFRIRLVATTDVRTLAAWRIRVSTRSTTPRPTLTTWRNCSIQRAGDTGTLPPIRWRERSSRVSWWSSPVAARQRSGLDCGPT